MVSRLDALFRTTFRTTEQTDTWLGIKRDDPQHERKKHDRRDEPDDGIFGEDDASLSLQALKGFLTMLLAQAQGKSPETAPVPAQADGSVPAQNMAQRASAAYQNTAQHGMPPVPPAPAQDTVPPMALSAVEIEKIQRLLAALKTLEARGATSIPLLPGETFLDSLIAGASDRLGEDV